MSNERSLRLWLAERRRQTVIAVLGATLAAVVYLLVDGESSLGSLVQGLALSAIFAAIAYLVANFILFSDDLEPSRFYERLQEIVSDRGLRNVAESAPAVDWHGFFNQRSGAAVRGFVRYLDEPLDRDRNAFVEFFRQGGSLILVLPDETDEAIVADIASQFDERNPSDPDRIARRIAATRDWLREALGEADEQSRAAGGAGCPPERLTLIATSRTLNYWSLTADDDRALFAPYDNRARSGHRMPIFEFDLSIAKSLATCLATEIDAFRAEATQ